MTEEVSTTDDLVYQFKPVTAGSLTFKVRAANDAHIALTAQPSDTEPIIEIFIGGWNNAKTVIRKNKAKPEKAEAETPGILNDSEFRGFWLRWSGGHIALGKEGETNPLIEWQDSEPFGIHYYGLSTGWGATGAWVIDVPQVGWAVPEATATGGAACWVVAKGGETPPNAVPGGFDNEQVYIGRARHEGALIPGKVIPSHGVCYIPWGGAEHGKDEYEVLCGCDAAWIAAVGGNLPEGALPSGETEDGEPLFVGRAHHEGTITVGKVQASHNCCYIPYGGQEIGYPEYEVLVAK